MNEIHIQDKIFFAVDERSVVIKEYTGKQDEKKGALYNVLGNYQTLQGATKKILRLNIARSQTENLNQLLDSLNNLDNKIDRILGKIKKGENK